MTDGRPGRGPRSPAPKSSAVMKYRTLPNTDITVSEVGFGLWTTSTGWWGETSDDDAVKLMHEALDLGITTFDAADTYGNGRSEEQLAKAFADRRDKVVYATKFGYDWYHHAGERKGQNEIEQDFSPTFVRYALEQSLKRLADRLRRRLPDAQRAHGAGARRRAHRAAGAVSRRRQDPHVGRRARARDRLAVGRHRVGARQRARRADDLEHARAVSRRSDGRGRERVRHRHDVLHPRAAQLGDARRALHEGHRVPADRPPQPPAAPVADQRHPESRDAALPRRARPHARPSGDPVAAATSRA